MGSQQDVCPLPFEVGGGPSTSGLDSSQFLLQQRSHIGPQAPVLKNNASNCPNREVPIKALACKKLSAHLCIEKEKLGVSILGI